MMKTSDAVVVGAGHKERIAALYLARAGGVLGGRSLERAELVRLLLLPEGMRVDLVTRQIVAVRPRASFLAPLRLA